MKLRSIQLDNVRQFAGQSMIISGLTDGLNVVAEPNEFGKSTVFDALQALFFRPFGSRHKDVMALQPAVAGGALRIVAEVEVEGNRFRIEKRFILRQMARITNLSPGGGVVAQDDGAETWLSHLLGSAHDGPAGLLWVRQGAVGFDTSDKARDGRRDILSSVVGEIDAVTGGRRFDTVLAQVEAALGLLSTDKGRPKAGGDWKAAQDAVLRLTAEVTDLTDQVTRLGEALTQRRKAEARLAGLDAPDAAATRARDLSAAAEALRAGEAHLAAVDNATRQAEIQRLRADEAARHHAALTEAEAQAATATSARDRAATAAADSGLLRAAVLDELATAEAGLRQAEVGRKALADLAAGHARHQAATTAARAAFDLAQRLTQAEAARAAIEAAEAAMAANPATPERLAALDRAGASLRDAGARLSTASVTLRVRHTGAGTAGAETAGAGTAGAGRLQLDGRDLPDGVMILPGAATLSWAGLAEVQIDPGAGQVATAQAAVDKARAAWQKALSVTGRPTPEAAAAAARDRSEAAQAVSVQTARLAVLASDGLAGLRSAAARAVAATDPDSVLPPQPPPDPKALARAEASHQTAASGLAAARARQTAALTADAVAAANLTHAQGRLAEAERARGDPATRDARRTALETALGQALAEKERAEQARRALAATAPDLKTLRADRDRAQGAVEAARTEAEGLRQRLGMLNGDIAARADQNVEERLTGATEALDVARTREAALAAEAAALDRLRQVLRDTRGAAQQAYFGPVQDELRPLLAILHQDAALSFDPARLLPGALRRGQTDEAVETLSGGTQEQIAILTRLAFARLLARQGRPVPVILDDALVHSDDERIVLMFKALNRVASDQQIIVLTCRQMAFTALGGHRPLITLGPIA